MDTLRIIDVDWNSHLEQIKQIRFRVFVDEQKVPPEEELDGHDPTCRHILAELPGSGFVGTARLLPDGHIGRVAVLAPFRGRSIGNAMVLHLISLARSLGHREVVLNSQESALGFYERLGFLRKGELFYDAGIPHIVMRLVL